MFDSAAVKAELAALVRTESGVPVFDGYGKEHNWTHDVAITKLDYYHELALPHNIDVMHTAKNVAESLFNTILNISMLRSYVIGRDNTCSLLKADKKGG